VKAESVQMLSSAALFSSVFFMPLVLKEELGVSAAEIGLIVAAYAASMLLSSWLFGRLADVRGRRMVMQMGLFACIGVSAIQYLTRTPESLTAARVLMGFAAGTFPSALMAYAYESTGKAGKFASYGAMGWIVGSFLAGVFAAYSPYAPFLLSTILFGAAFAVSLALPFPKDVHLNVPMFPVDVIKRNAPAYVAVLLRHTGAHMIWVVYPIMLAQINPDPVWIGAVYAVNASTQFVIMQLIDRFDGRRLLIWGLALSALTFYLFTISTTEWMVFVDQLFLGGSWACMYVGALKCILANNVERSTSNGLLDSTLSLSMIGGSVGGGFVAAAFGYVATMYVATISSIIAIAVFVLMVNGRAKAASAPSSGRAPASSEIRQS
jgi:MFS family permease